MSEMDDARATDAVASSYDTFAAPVTFRLDELGTQDAMETAGEPLAAARSFPRLVEPDDERTAGPALRRILEAILFATDRPVTVEQLQIALPDRADDDLVRELEDMAADYEAMEAGFRLLPCAGGWQIRTDPEMHEFVTRFLVGKKRTRLSRAAMETLAMIAYRQPITRGEVEEIRGVDSGQVFHTLLERNLVTVKGRSQALGRPLLYGTTEEFLRYFGLNALADLPSPQELQALLGDDPLDDPDIRQALVTRGFEPAGGEDAGGETVAAAAGAATAVAAAAAGAADAEASAVEGGADAAGEAPAADETAGAAAEPCV